MVSWLRGCANGTEVFQACPFFLLFFDFWPFGPVRVRLFAKNIHMPVRIGVNIQTLLLSKRKQYARVEFTFPLRVGNNDQTQSWALLSLRVALQHTAAVQCLTCRLDLKIWSLALHAGTDLGHRSPEVRLTALQGASSVNSVVLFEWFCNWKLFFF